MSHWFTPNIKEQTDSGNAHAEVSNSWIQNVDTDIQIAEENLFRLCTNKSINTSSCSMKPVCLKSYNLN